jgi:lipoprotein-anchoring transpeptidase ErfK/SrfK
MLIPILRISLLLISLLISNFALAQATPPRPPEFVPDTIDELLATQAPVTTAPLAPAPPPSAIIPPDQMPPQAALPIAAPLPAVVPPVAPSLLPPPSSQPPAAAAPVAPPVSEIATVNPADVLAVEYSGGPLPDGFSVLTLKLQILLDQAGMSPGIIDGINGRNVAKAVAGVETLMGVPVDGVLDAAVWQRLPRDTPVLVEYEITPEDVAGPFLSSVPTDFSEMAKLDALSYTGPLEMFGERFHMDVVLLSKLNPGADFSRAGTTVVVAGASGYAVKIPVASLIADKVNAQLRGYNAEGKLVVTYPATIGSDELPSPSGTHSVNAIATEAAYYYNPDRNFRQGDNKDKLKLPPGPNNPIGTTWIDLTEPTYGIHGTPEPSKIDKTRSHGCIRLTNWDVEELAGLVKKGVPVEFR